jgi:hypothetical protein
MTTFPDKPNICTCEPCEIIRRCTKCRGKGFNYKHRYTHRGYEGSFAQDCHCKRPCVGSPPEQTAP